MIVAGTSSGRQTQQQVKGMLILLSALQRDQILIRCCAPNTIQTALTSTR